MNHGVWNTSADEQLPDKHGEVEQSWMENEVISHDDSSQRHHETFEKRVAGEGIIPHKRRNKYLSNGGEEPVNYGLNLSDETAHESTNDPLMPKKRKNIHLQPLDHNPNSRTASVPPGISGNVPHPLNFAPSPATGINRGNAGIRL